MALTGVTPPVPSNVFEWGRQGQIEMKPMDVVSQSSWFQQPKSEEVQQLLTADPRELLQRQFDDESQLLQTTLTQAEEKITRDAKYKLATLDQEYGLKVQQLHNRIFTPPLKEKETKQDRIVQYQTALGDLDSQMQIARLRISDKVKPDLDLLQTKSQELVNQQQQKYRDKQIELDVIDQLEQEGAIVDPYSAKVARLRVAGVNVPVTMLRPEPLNLDQEFARIDGQIRALDRQLAPENLYQYNPTTNEIETVDVEAATELKNQLTRYRNEFLLPMMNPQFRDIYKRSGKLTAAAEQARGKVVPATGEPTRTIGTIVEQAKPKFQSTKQKADPLGIR